MDNKMKKSKYAALMLASTIALSAVATVTPEAFGGETIEAQAATSQAATSVKEKIQALKFGETTYKSDVVNARTAFNGLTEAADKKAVANLEATLKAHEAVATDDFINKAKAVTDLSEDTIKGYKTVSPAADGLKTVVAGKDKKGKDILRGVNDDVEAAATKLSDFKKAYDVLIAKDKNTKKVLANTYKSYTTLSKVVTAQQKTIDAIYYATPVVNILNALERGGDVALETTELKVSKGKFKIDGDQYTANIKDGKIEVLGPHGEQIVTPAETVTFTVANTDFENTVSDSKDADEDKAVTVTPGTQGNANNSTLFDEYKATIVQGVVKVEKIDSKVTLNDPLKKLELDSKMDVAAYKGLTAGTTKYSDAQIEVLQKLAAEYKKLSSPAKKALTADQTADIKAYAASLKTQQALEKKLASTNSKGVTQLISKLKYKNDLAKYEDDIIDAEKAYEKLSSKYQKKVKVATVTSLKNHKAAVKIMKKIDKLDTTELVKGEPTTNLEVAIEKINGKTGVYTTADKKVKSLVKNYKEITTLNKLIATNKNYIKANTPASGEANGIITKFEDALAALTQKKTVRIVNNQVYLKDKVFDITTDKSSKLVTISNVTGTGEAAVTTKIEVPTDTTVTGTDGYADYTFVNAKGKLSISKKNETADKAKTTAAVIDFKNVTTDAFKELAADKKYSDDQKAAIQAAIDAQTALNKNSVAKKFVNKEDTTALKAYQTALKQQTALETKISKEDFKALTTQVAGLKYSVDKVTETGDYKDKSVYEKEVAAAQDAYDLYIGHKVKGTDGKLVVVTKDNNEYAGDPAKIKEAEALKTKLADHKAAAEFATLMIAVPAEITAENEATAKTAITTARTKFNALTATQKKLVTAGETALKTAEKATTPTEVPTSATATLSGKTLKVLFDKDVQVETAVDNAAFVAAVTAKAAETAEDGSITTPAVEAKAAITASISTVSKNTRTVEINFSGELDNTSTGTFEFTVVSPETATTKKATSTWTVTLAANKTITVAKKAGANSTPTEGE